MMSLYRFQMFFVTIFVVIGLSSCSSNNESGATQTTLGSSSTIEGILLDAPISGVTYTCDGLEHLTDTEGHFECQSFPIVFSIGPIEIGEINALGVDLYLLPQDLLGIARHNLSDEELTALLILLQSLDSDEDLSNGIQISQTDIDEILQQDNRVRTVQEMGYTGVISMLYELNITAVSADAARLHLQDEMSKYLNECHIISDIEMLIKMNNRGTQGVYFNGVDQDLLTTTQGEHGHSEIYSVANEFVNIYYTPEVDFVGEDNFTYTLNGCSKNVHVVVGTTLPAAQEESVVFAFRDNANGTEPWITDGTPAGTRLLDDLESGQPSSISLGQYMPKVNDNFVYSAYDIASSKIRLYSSTNEGTHYINHIDQDTYSSRPLGFFSRDEVGADFRVNQQYVKVTRSDTPKSKVISLYGQDYLYYNAYSPASNDVEYGGASGDLAWKTTGRAPYSFSVDDDPTVLYAKDRWCEYHFQVALGISGTCYNTNLVEDITGDGIALDKVVSNYVQIGAYVYYVGMSDQTWWLFRDDLTQAVANPERIRIYQGEAFDDEVQLATLNNKIYIALYDNHYMNGDPNLYPDNHSQLLVGDVETFYTKTKDLHNVTYFVKNSGTLLHQVDLNGTYTIAKNGFNIMDDELYFWTTSRDTNKGDLFKIASSGDINQVNAVESLRIRAFASTNDVLFYSAGYTLKAYDKSGVIPPESNLLSSTQYINTLEEIHGKVYAILDDTKLVEFDPKLGEALVGSGGHVIDDDGCNIYINSEQLNESTLLYVKECTSSVSAILYHQLSQIKTVLK